jgi:hypothetical protein
VASAVKITSQKIFFDPALEEGSLIEIRSVDASLSF